MVTSDNSTHLSESSTHGERLWLTPSTRIQTSEQEYNDLAASNRRLSTLLPKHLLSFSRKTRSYALPRSTKHVFTVGYVFGMLPRFLENVMESGILFCCATAATKTALCITQLWFNYFAASFYKALGVHFSREAEERNGPVFRALTPVSLSVYRDDHDQFANL